MTNCRSCQKEIQSKAKKCKHCKRWCLQRFIPNPKYAALILAISGLLAIGLSVSHSNRVKNAQQKARHEAALAAQKKAEQERLKSLDDKLSAEYEKFQRDSNDAIQELSRLEAATETGINLLRYSELLANVNYKVSNYRQQYAGTVQSRFPVYGSILASMGAYAQAADCWRSKNEAYRYSSLASDFEELLQKAWRIGSEELGKARQSIKKAPGLELWRQPDYYQAYLNQVLSAKEDLQFALQHQSQLNQRSVDDSKNCDANYARLHYALEIWSSQHEGRYPKSLGDLVPKYLEAIPTCPSAGDYSYDSTDDNGPPDLFVINCPNHPKPVPDAIKATLEQLGLGDDSK